MSKNTAVVGLELPVLDLNDCCAPIRREAIDAEGAATLAEAFKALADPLRLQLLNLIATADSGEACACDLVEPVGKSQPTVSHHLSLLVAAEVLEREQRGKWAWYRIVPERLQALQAVLAT